MIKTLIKAAKAWGIELLEHFDTKLQLQQKSTYADFCTQADLASEEKILKVIKNSKLKDRNIYAEENGKINNNSEYTIVIDPLDGTNNFSLNLPNYTVSIWVTKNDKIIAGVIYIPTLDTVYYAEKGKWARKNTTKISVNTENAIQKSTISIVVPYDIDYESRGKLFKQLRDKRTKRILTNRSVAYDFCLLASGKIDAMVLDRIPLYDYCAGKIIALESGAKITYQTWEFSDKNGNFIITNSSNKLHSEFLSVVKESFGL